MIQKKICMLGAFAVGKTSLVSRFVHSIFSDKYLTTIGVQIEKKSVQLESGRMDLVLWDIYGEDDFQKVRMSYVRGASGYLLVIDGTRRTSLDTAVSLHESAQRAIGPVPCIVVINKADLIESWEVDQSALVRRGWKVVTTSAKTGDGVEDAFVMLAREMARS